MKKEKSFTLIELLVVISIIGLLASLVLVSTRGLQQKAKITKTLEFSQSLNNSLGAYAVGRWDFDEGLGTQAKDSSGYGNNGTISGASYNADTPHAAIGRGTGKWALSFNGAGNYVSVPNSSSLNIANAITIEFWTKRGSSQSFEWVYPVMRGGGGSYAVNYNRSDNLYRLYSNLSVGGWQGVVTSGNSSYTPAGAWVHLATTYDSSTGQARFYINGELKNTVAKSGTISVGNFPLYLGGDGPAEPYNGLIDEVRIYEKALTIGQIQQHYAEGLKGHQDLVIK